MMESAISMGVVWAAYGLARFSRTGSLPRRGQSSISAASPGTAAAVWGLIPYGGVVVAVAARRHGFPWRKVQTFVIAYVVAAGYLPLLWLAWNFYLQNDPFYFAHYSSGTSRRVS